jgi:hypothetical protein
MGPSGFLAASFLARDRGTTAAGASGDTWTTASTVMMDGTANIRIAANILMNITARVALSTSEAMKGAMVAVTRTLAGSMSTESTKTIPIKANNAQASQISS